jgi:hypothetical protein
MATRSKSKLWQYWGYGVLVILILAVLGNAAGPGMYAICVGLLAVYLLLQAPVYCGAINRITRQGQVEFCRNNSAGLILGCHLRQHKWQKLGQQWWSLSWRQKAQGIWTGAGAKLATLGFVIGTITGVFGMVHDLVG